MSHSATAEPLTEDVASLSPSSRVACGRKVTITVAMFGGKLQTRGLQT